MKVKNESEVAQSCPTLSDPLDCSLPGSSIHGIFQAKVLEWGAVAKLCPTLCDPMDVAHQAPLSMGFPSQEYWSGLPFPSLVDLLNSKTEPELPASPALQAHSLQLSNQGRPWLNKP